MQIPVDLTLEIAPPIVIHQVPLVVGDHQGTSGFHHQRQYPGVLLADRLSGIHEDDRHLRLIKSGLRPQRRIKLMPTCRAHPTTDTGSVDKPPQAILQLHKFVNRINRCARHRVDHDPVFSRQLIQQ